MAIFSISRALDFLRACQNPDGGWGYVKGRASLVEPTGFCTLCLRSTGNQTASGRGLGFLRDCQSGSGAVGVNPRTRAGNWMAYAALLAFHGLGAENEERQLKAWILSFEDASSSFTKDELAAIKSRYHYDGSIQGWPWTPRTTAWVEPTALFILALRCTGVPVMNRRIASGVNLLFDRKIPSGGWNFGNPFSAAYELEAIPLATAIVLTSLSSMGIAETNKAVAEGLRYLGRCLEGDVSVITLAWSLLAFKSYPGPLSQVPAIANRLAGMQAGDGSFRDNPFETALVCLIMSDDPVLSPRPGGSR